MMLCWGREGQVDGGPLVLSDLCWNLISHPNLSCLHPVCSGTCQSTEFHCSDGCCIDSFLECDGIPDCPDASDEATCDKCEAWEIERWWAAEGEVLTIYPAPIRDPCWACASDLSSCRCQWLRGASEVSFPQ